MANARLATALETVSYSEYRGSPFVDPPEVLGCLGRLFRTMWKRELVQLVSLILLVRRSVAHVQL